MNLEEHSHHRRNALTGEWVLVSPQRAQRPWQGQVEAAPRVELAAYDPGCYLCPGNSRAGGAINPAYPDTFVFNNDFPALSRPGIDDEPEPTVSSHELLQARSEKGVCRVVCFSPRHDLTLADMPVEQVAGVVDLWADQAAELGAMADIQHVQVFENRGEMMGCSNPHPHGQIWAGASLPEEARKELSGQKSYYEKHGRPLLTDYAALESAAEDRLVSSNAHFVGVVPFWAVWPFETLIAPRRPRASFEDLSGDERSSLADILQKITLRYDNLFDVPFPYSMGFHIAPYDGEPHPEWVFHAHFYPPLLRSATVRKFLVGYEMLAMPQRDLTPEQAAARLRAAG